MLFDVEITYRADFVPKRARNVRKGRIVEKIPLSVPEIPSDEAPVVLRVRNGDATHAVRTHGGMLYEPVPNPSGFPDIRLGTVRGRAANLMIEIGLWAKDRHLEPDADAVVVSSDRDISVREVGERISTDLLLIDDVIHRRARSPVVPIEAFVEEYGEAFEYGFDAAPEDASRRFVPAWFPPSVGGVPFRTFVSSLPIPSDNMQDGDDAYRADLLGRLNAEIVDAALLDTVCDDPRNVHVAGVVEHMLDAYMEDAGSRNVLVDATGRAGWMTHILHAVADAEEAIGTPLPEIEAALERVASRSPAYRSEPFTDPEGLGGSAIQLSVEGESSDLPSIVTRRSWEALHSTKGRKLLFQGKDLDRAVETATAAGRRNLGFLVHEHVKDWDDRFDYAGWNARVLLGQLILDLDARLGLMPKTYVDGVARLSAHLRDWRTDPRLVADPSSEAQFMADATMFIWMLFDPLLDDVGKPWQRDMFSSELGVVAARLQSAIVDDDPELRDFSL